jgi:vancomycin aglycone glucosyltransferase
MPAPPGAGRVLVDAARAVGRRAVVSRGWANLGVDDAADCFVVGDVNQQALFPRVAAVVHHGGAGTTAAAARAGAPQVIAPLFSDQFYWASRVRAVGVGSSVDGGLSVAALADALAVALNDDVAGRARALVADLADDGARVAAQRLVDAAR